MKSHLTSACGYCGGPFRSGQLPKLAPALGRAVHEPCLERLEAIQGKARAEAAKKARAAAAPPVRHPNEDFEALLQQVPRLRELGVAEACSGTARIALLPAGWPPAFGAGAAAPAAELEREAPPEPPSDDDAFGASG